MLGDASKARRQLGWTPQVDVRRARARDGRARLAARRSATRSSSAKDSPPTSTTNEQGPPRFSSPAHAASWVRRSAVRSPLAAYDPCLGAVAQRARSARPRPPSSGSSPRERPEYVFMAAAKVGGIVANDTYPADFIRDNLVIQTNVIDAAYRNGTRKFCFLGSSCIYPRLAPQPMTRGVAADRTARADERVVCRRQDRRHQDVPGVRASVRLQRDLRDADEPLRPRRQLRLADVARAAGAAAQVPRGKASRRRRGDGLGLRHAAPRVPVRRRPGRRAAAS